MSSCSNKISYYQGYIYKNNMPQENIRVVGRDHSDTISMTNEKGYFKLNKRANWIEKYLHLYSGDKKIDSISVVRTHPEYGIRYYFVEGRNDTLFLKNDKIINK